MSLTASPGVVVACADERLEVLFEELAELTGQRNAIDGRIVEIVAEMDRDQLCGATGARSIAALVAWKTGTSTGNAKSIATVARRLATFPRCAKGLREGRLSLDQVGVIASRAADGSDAHYAELALRDGPPAAHRGQTRNPNPTPMSLLGPTRRPRSPKAPTSSSAAIGSHLPHLEAAKFDAALASHRDALIAEWKLDRETHRRASDNAPPLPGTIEAFMRLVEAGWDAEATRRPHGQHTTVVAHLDVKDKTAALHLGPLLTDADRQYLTCDATCEVWFERHGQALGAGRATRQINRRLRRALEHRHRTCAVPRV